MKTIRIGFIPLMDAALLIVAHEKGFAAREELALDLVRDVSWANLRDRLAVGMIDAAHMLAPAAIAATLGLGQARAEMASPILLNRNGNAITVSAAIFADMQQRAGAAIDDLDSSARAFALVVAARAKAGGEPPVLASVYPFSMHTLLLREWLGRGGLTLGEDVSMIVLPPPFMAQGLEDGQIDGFCVGAPWNMLATQTSTGAIVALGCELIPDAPEKLLAFRRRDLDADGSSAVALARAIRLAAEWTRQPQNTAELAELLAKPAYLDLPSGLIEAILNGRLGIGAGRPARLVPDYLSFQSDRLAPDAATARTIIERMAAAGQIGRDTATQAKAKAVFRIDCYNMALR